MTYQSTTAPLLAIRTVTYCTEIKWTPHRLADQVLGLQRQRPSRRRHLRGPVPSDRRSVLLSTHWLRFQEAGIHNPAKAVAVKRVIARELKRHVQRTQLTKTNGQRMGNSRPDRFRWSTPSTLDELRSRSISLASGVPSGLESRRKSPDRHLLPTLEAVYYSLPVPMNRRSLTMLALVFDKLHFSDVYLPRVDFNLDLVEAEARWIERLSNSTTSAPQCCSHRFAL